MKIYSKIKPELLLHIVNRCSDITETRQDLCPDDQYLQAASFILNEGKTFRPHRHLKLERHTDVTQESWIIIKGKIKAILYDIDDTILAEPLLEQGDCSITFRGGHNYICMEDNTYVYEYKTGPYIGQEKDKTFIE